MTEYKKISIVIPVFNEAATIKHVIDQVVLINTFNIPKEVILVDDCSTDGTVRILSEIHNPEIKIIFKEKNEGKGAALKTGFAQATGDIVVIQDADTEYDPKEISNLLKPFLSQGAKVVFGSRYLSPSTGLSFWHSFFNRAFTSLGNLLIGTNITDIMTCYKAFDREVLGRLRDDLQSKRFGFEPEVTVRIVKANYKIVEVPISYNPRSKEQGKHMNLMGEMESLWALIKYSFLVK